jgi:hypothetical protein
MTRDDFDAALDLLRISPGEFAALTGQNPATVRGWGKVRMSGGGQRRLQDVPGWVSPLLEAWQAAPRALAARRRQLEPT